MGLLTRRGERRKRRSRQAERALTLWLRSTARRMRIPAFVLGDGSGLLIASNLEGDRPEELAALAPLLQRKDARGQTPIERHCVPLAINTIHHEGGALLLTAVSGDAEHCRRGLAVACFGVRRILRELVPV